MAKKLKTLKIDCDPAITLNDEGYAALISQIQDALSADEETLYQVTSLTLEVLPSDVDANDAASSDENAE